MVSATVFLLFLLLWLGVAVLWHWSLLWRPFRRHGSDAPLWAWWALQLTVLTAILSFAMRDAFAAILILSFPPTLLLDLSRLGRFMEFLWVPFLWASGIAALIFVLACSIGIWGRRLSLGLAGMAWLAAVIVVAEQASDRAMCLALEAQGLTNLQRNSFAWSIAHTPREFQFEIHAVANGPEGRFGWSYREQAFYRLKSGNNGDVTGGEHVDCGE